MKYDAILVLGRGISEAGTLPDMSVESVKKAKKLLENGTAERVVFCGKWSRHYKYTPPLTEAVAMKKLALELGVPKEKIFLEKESLDTISNFYYAKKNFLEPNRWKNVLLLVLHKNDERALITAKYVLGPSFSCDSLSIDYNFPPDKLAIIEQREKEKVQILKDFLEKNHIVPGDHERIFQEHLDYIKKHEITSTF